MNTFRQDARRAAAASLLVALIGATQACIAQTPKVKTGLEVLKQRKFDILRGKRIGLITNPTGVDAWLRSTIDILHEAPGVRLVALFGPEHGARGDFAAGASVETYTDSATKLPVYSLYGKTRRPTPDMLKGLDALVYDIQDIGCRSYTYISTMGLAIDAAGEHGIEFIVLDRPNPLGGQKVEGNLVTKGRESFVGQYPIPYVYGLTCGELAKMIIGEEMLPYAAKCRLSVVPMQGWSRSMTYEQTGLQWVPASPHIPNPDSPAYYVATGVMGELGVISEGVGYTIPFRTFAAEWIDPAAFADRLTRLNLRGVMFRPITFRPFYGAHADQQLKGVQIYITDPNQVDLTGLQFRLMQVHNELYPNKNPFKLAERSRLDMFDKVAGSDEVRRLFTRRMSYDDVHSFLQQDVGPFRKLSRKYYLYNN